jgi:hypothetical protein
MVYDCAKTYIESQTTLLAKIKAMNAIITALEGVALTAAETADLSEYALDDGQTKIKTQYRDMNQVLASILSFTRLKNMYVNQYNGHGHRAMDLKNFNPWI